VVVVIARRMASIAGTTVLGVQSDALLLDFTYPSSGMNNA